MSDRISNLETLLAGGKDSAMLRFSLGGEYLKQDATDKAVEHLGQAVALDPGYSAAWKLYGKACECAGKVHEATHAYKSGIEAAEKHGDIQAMKEMQVFLKRLEKNRHQNRGS